MLKIAEGYSFEWYFKSANNGYAEGQNNLVIDNGIKEDEKRRLNII